MKKHVLHTIFSFYTGGAELMLIDIMNVQCEYINVSLLIINDYDDELFKKINKKVNIICLDRNRKSKNPLPFIKANLIALKNRYSIIHCHNINLIDLFILKKIKRKTVLTIHDTKIQYNNFDKYNTLYAISKSVKRDVKKRYDVESVIVYNGVDTSQIKSKQTFNLKNNRMFRIVQVSRLMHTKKGQDILIKALKKIIDIDKNINFSIDFIGDGESKEYLEKLVKKLNISDRVAFLGLKDREFIYSNLYNYDLLVQPSIYEGFGLTVAEAMIAQVPVLVSDIEGPMEVIKEGKYGFYFKKGDVDDLVDKLAYLINNKPKQEFVEEAYKYAKKEFNIENTAKKYIEEYDNIRL